jgi:four helix bundle protein
MGKPAGTRFSYRDLEVWQKAMDLAETVYSLSRTFPVEERFGLISQMQRSAVSVPANIAEGQGRKHRGEFVRHLTIARGSLAELETHLLLAGRLGYAGKDRLGALWRQAQEVGRLLNGLIRSLDKEPGRRLQPATDNRQPTTEVQS